MSSIFRSGVHLGVVLCALALLAVGLIPAFHGPMQTFQTAAPHAPVAAICSYGCR